MISCWWVNVIAELEISNWKEKLRTRSSLLSKAFIWTPLLFLFLCCFSGWAFFCWDFLVCFGFFFFFLLLVKEWRIGTEFQSTDSWDHNEELGYSHFLPLFEINRMALADAALGCRAWWKEMLFIFMEYGKLLSDYFVHHIWQACKRLCCVLLYTSWPPVAPRLLTSGKILAK